MLRNQLDIPLLLVGLLVLGGCPTPSIVIDDDDATTDDDDATADDDDATADDDDATADDDDDDATADDDDSTADDDDATADDDDSGGDDDDVANDDDATASGWVFGDLVITELILNPISTDDGKEWIELFNNSGAEVDLQGLTFYDDGSDDFTVSTSVLVADGDFVVLGQSADTSVNGDVAVDYAYGLSGMTLGNSDDELYIEAPDGVLIDSILWDNGATFPDPNGESMNLDPLFFDATLNDDGLNWCESTAPAFGTNMDLGTPGAANVSCTPLGDDDDSAGDDDDSAVGDDDDSAVGDDDDSAVGDDDDSAVGDDDDSATGDDDDSAVGDDDDSAVGDDDDSAVGDDDDSAVGDDDDSAVGDDDDSAVGDDDDSAVGDDDDSASSSCDPEPWINELHYDNSGADANEGVEIAGPAGFDLTGWALEFYNGANGSPYVNLPLTGTLPDDGSGLGAIWFAQSGIQNGAPDGLALMDPLGLIVSFLSYEGSLTASGGAAIGQTSVDIGVFESGGVTATESLQLGGTGCSLADFVWQVPQTNTQGAVNTGQTFQQ
ncbi:MAG: lamin tail domain-containing protein [Deltaproteobacteria bacterium]|nr:lamin tail domain-containing protein [Deltaproteobacteria bacterium]